VRSWQGWGDLREPWVRLVDTHHRTSFFYHELKLQ
jgi:hypothetical protein